jgi:serine protease Do
MPLPVPGKLAENVRQSVVQVRGIGGGSGAGVVIADTHIITNAHVIRSRKILIETWEGKELPVLAVKLNRSRDLALLSVSTLKTAPLPLGDSRALKPGTPVFAIGHPMGFVGAVSSGVIHQVSVPRWVCAEVRLAPGNSGGPLVNFSGQLIGINTMVASGGLALAVPSRDVERFLKQDDARSLGVSVKSVDFKGRFGILVTGVVPGSPAEGASLMPGDVLIASGGVTFRHTDDLTDAICEATNGLLHLDFYRGDGQSTRHVTVDLTRQNVKTAA